MYLDHYPGLIYFLLGRKRPKVFDCNLQAAISISDCPSFPNLPLKMKMKLWLKIRFCLSPNLWSFLLWLLIREWKGQYSHFSGRLILLAKSIHIQASKFLCNLPSDWPWDMLVSVRVTHGCDLLSSDLARVPLKNSRQSSWMTWILPKKILDKFQKKWNHNKQIWSCNTNTVTALD